MEKIFIHNSSAKRGSFTLRPLFPTFGGGKISAILGRTGSGRTVLLEVIGGMFPGTDGSIQHDGVDMMDIPPRNHKLGFVYQDHGLSPRMKVCDDISYGLKMRGFSKEEQRRRIPGLMEMLSVARIKNQYPGALSGGESQGTALVRTLALEPEAFLLDESFSTLDPVTREQLYLEPTRIYEHFRCTTIFVTHGSVEARLLARRAGILLNGELKAVASLDKLMDGHHCGEVEQFLGGG